MSATASRALYRSLAYDLEVAVIAATQPDTDKEEIMEALVISVGYTLKNNDPAFKMDAFIDAVYTK